MILTNVIIGLTLYSRPLTTACTKRHLLATCHRVRFILHEVALFIIALSALVYISAALGLWVEHAETVDLFGCAKEWAINPERLEDSHARADGGDRASR